jgi:integrase
MDNAHGTTRARPRSTSRRSATPNVQKRSNQDGSTSWVALVRVRPFHARSRSFPDRATAIRWADDEKRKLIAEREAAADARADLTSLTVAQLAKAYLEDPETIALLSYKDSCARLAWWVNELGEKRIRELGVVTLREARDRLARTGITPATTNRYLAALRSAWNWGRAAGYLSANQVWPPRLLLTEAKGRTRHLSDEELANLLSVAKAHGATLHAAIIVSIACGLRKGELLRLRWNHVDFDSSSLRILSEAQENRQRDSKNGEARGVHLPASAAAALRTLKRSTIIAPAVFITEDGQPANQDWIERHWRKIRTAAGLAGFRWHDLRHSCASFLAASGASLLEIGSVLGHKSAATTKRYAHLVDARAVTGHAALDAMLTGK